MGSFIELNDTLRISKAQGFPKGLDLQKHLQNPYKSENFVGKVFHFKAKPKIRVYQQPPVRNFLVEDVAGKWVYWGKCHILEIHHDYTAQETSGTFKILSLNTPEMMQQAFELIDLTPENNYFA
jgi:hypothetical protein